jgi:hypothetical protein
LEEKKSGTLPSENERVKRTKKGRREGAFFGYRKGKNPQKSDLFD